MKNPDCVRIVRKNGKSRTIRYACVSDKAKIPPSFQNLKTLSRVRAQAELSDKAVAA